MGGRRHAALAVWAGGVLVAPARPWGPVAHEMVNQYALVCLPPDLKPLFQKHSREFIVASTEPDSWKSYDPDESPRHYIDLDELLPYPFENFPLRFEQASARWGEKLFQAGILPWRIEEMVERLAADFRAGRSEQAVRTAAHLGHYIADLHEPLHTTENYDGQLTGNDGIHLRWEDVMIARFAESLRISTASAERLGDPVEWTLATIREGYPFLETIFEADELAQRRFGLGTGYYEELFRRTRPVAEVRISKAAESLAGWIFTAWIRAGRPRLD